MVLLKQSSKMEFDRVLGFSEGFHDAALCVVDTEGEILFASSSERYSGRKNDSRITTKLIQAAHPFLQDRQYVKAYYEDQQKKNWRMMLSGQRKCKPTTMSYDYSYPHHMSHAAAAFQTGPYNEAVAVVIDAIGEFDTASIWTCSYKDGKAVYNKKWSMKYPKSLGLFYSAMTGRVSLRPMDEEYIMMGMAAYGKPIYVNEMKPLLKRNLHRGARYFQPDGKDVDIAATAQRILEEGVLSIFDKASKYGDNFVYGGGVALNCVANSIIVKKYPNLWIMPCPGDAGGALGAAALTVGCKLNWKDPYLGYELPTVDEKEVVKQLLKNKIVGVASGKAEFGPRALGNRSLLADPRGATIKNDVNAIKNRQKFRPFAPAILEEHYHNYFLGNPDSKYMQYTSICTKPHEFPAIVHADNTSRVQTVGPNDNTILRKVLELWYKKTKCPMLLNTSLNIRNSPMVNDYYDAISFGKMYDVPVIVK